MGRRGWGRKHRWWDVGSTWIHHQSIDLSCDVSFLSGLINRETATDLSGPVQSLCHWQESESLRPKKSLSHYASQRLPSRILTSVVKGSVIDLCFQSCHALLRTGCEVISHLTLLWDPTFLLSDVAWSFCGAFNQLLWPRVAVPYWVIILPARAHMCMSYGIWSQSHLWLLSALQIPF